jgi:hypothetical protein
MAALPKLCTALTALALLSTACRTTGRSDWYDEGWYVGAAGGIAKLHVSESDVEDDLDDLGYAASVSIDDDDFAWRGFVGFRFAAPIGIEASWVDLGMVEADVSAAPTGMFLEELADAHPFLGQGPSLGAYVYPLENDYVALGLGGGMWYWQTELEVSDASGNRAEIDDDGFDPFAGAHVLFDLSRLFQLRFEYQAYFIDDDYASLVTAGLQVRPY